MDDVPKLELYSSFSFSTRCGVEHSVRCVIDFLSETEWLQSPTRGYDSDSLLGSR